SRTRSEHASPASTGQTPRKWAATTTATAKRWRATVIALSVLISCRSRSAGVTGVPLALDQLPVRPEERVVRGLDDRARLGVMAVRLDRHGVAADPVPQDREPDRRSVVHEAVLAGGLRLDRLVAAGPSPLGPRRKRLAGLVDRSVEGDHDGFAGEIDGPERASPLVDLPEHDDPAAVPAVPDVNDAQEPVDEVRPVERVELLLVGEVLRGVEAVDRAEGVEGEDLLGDRGLRGHVPLPPGPVRAGRPHEGGVCRGHVLGLGVVADLVADGLAVLADRHLGDEGAGAELQAWGEVEA